MGAWDVAAVAAPDPDGVGLTGVGEGAGVTVVEGSIKPILREAKAAAERAARAHVWCVGLDSEGDTSVFDLPVADQPLVLVLGAVLLQTFATEQLADENEALRDIPTHDSTPPRTVVKYRGHDGCRVEVNYLPRS